jgi:hypothetical protein
LTSSEHLNSAEKAWNGFRNQDCERRGEDKMETRWRQDGDKMATKWAGWSFVSELIIKVEFYRKV